MPIGAEREARDDEQSGETLPGAGSRGLQVWALIELDPVRTGLRHSVDVALVGESGLRCPPQREES